jgi:2-hydroxychromene-2-carboxylate isomerase
MVVAASQITLPARIAARARRSAGGHGRVELFFAFDDPCSAVAVTDLATRLASRPVELVLLPVVRRGIEGDPAATLKRQYALADARRLARRGGLELGRREPLAPADTAFLAEWVAGATSGPVAGSPLVGFCVAALRRLWFDGAASIEPSAYFELWREHTGFRPRPDAAAVQACESRMRRRGPYETPAAWVAGRWYFAQDRPEQICEWLQELGW